MITKKVFDTLADGSQVTAYTMTNRFDASVTVLDYGGIIQSLRIPDRTDTIKDIVCGFDCVEDYKNGGGYFGAIIGRYGNRIAEGRFTLGDKEYTLAKNDGDNHLHGGDEGFNAKMWSVETIERDDKDQLILEYTSEDMEEGYPGKLKVSVTYSFSDAYVLGIRYEAFSDKDTICNLTNHSYFNLAGYASCDIGRHRCYINADYITDVDDDLIPTGEQLAVKGTKFDFLRFTPMTEAIDHNYCLKNEGRLEKVAEVREPDHGRAMEVWTNCPGMQLYTANMMNGDVAFKGGIPQTPHTAFCMETQYWPDSPNHENFPSCVLRAGAAYDFTTEYHFKQV